MRQKLGELYLPLPLIHRILRLALDRYSRNRDGRRLIVEEAIDMLENPKYVLLMVGNGRSGAITHLSLYRTNDKALRGMRKLNISWNPGATNTAFDGISVDDQAPMWARIMPIKLQ